MKTETIWLQETDGVPNNPRLPVLLHRQAFAPATPAAAEAMFAAQGWPPAWRNGIYDYVHLHTAAHEALAIGAGEVTVELGGEGGPVVAVQAGDVLVLPAGTGHRNLGQSDDLLVVGAYPKGQAPDTCRADAGSLAEARARIARLPDPPGCPVNGQAYPRRP